MDIEITNTHGINVLKLQGRLDVASSPELEKQMKGLLDSGADRILLDLVRLEFLSSSGPRIFIQCAKRIKDVNGKLVLCGMNPSVLKVFKITQLDSVFDIHEGLEEAISFFGK